MEKLGIPPINISVLPDNLTIFQKLDRYYRQFLEIPGIKRFISEIEELPEFKRHIGRKINYGNMIMDFYPRDLFTWFVWQASERSIEEAKNDVIEFLNRDENETLIAFWVTGFSVEETYEIYDGIEVVPVKNMPLSDDKVFLSQTYKDLWANMREYPEVAITSKFRYSKFYSEKNETKDKKVNNQNRPNDESVIALLFNLIHGVRCNFYILSRYPHNLPSVRIGSYHTTVFRHYNIHSISQPKISADQINELRSLFQQFKELDDKRARLFYRSLVRLANAKAEGTSNLENAIVELCICLEMVLLDDNPNFQQLSLAFRLRGVWLLKDKYSNSEYVYNVLNKIYSYRSRVAHGGELITKKVGLNQIRDEFDDYLKVTVDVLKELLERGSIPNWKRLLIGIKGG